MCYETFSFSDCRFSHVDPLHSRFKFLPGQTKRPSLTEEHVTITISTAHPDSTVLFESIHVGEWNGAAPADSQATPFTFTVSTTNFYGTFHKLKGHSAMVVTLVAQKDGKTTWEAEKEYNRISQVILSGNFTSFDGK